MAQYEFDKIFPVSRLIDIHEYLLEKGEKLEGIEGTCYLYHDPCHTPMKQQDPLKTVNALIKTADGSRVEKSERCCGEAGTLAVFFFSSRRRHTSYIGDWSSDVCSSD